MHRSGGTTPLLVNCQGGQCDSDIVVATTKTMIVEAVTWISCIATTSTGIFNPAAAVGEGKEKGALYSTTTTL
jgi:hypothetical protein